MFNHPHHQKIHLLLQSLDSKIFFESSAYFGGGTLITLLHNEYRWSKDVDFICPIGDGYKALRKLVSDNYFAPSIFFKSTTHLKFPRELKADQYGIRFAVLVDDMPIKFEIVAEARLELDPPEKLTWIDVPSLSLIDQYAEKLLANADRWYDSSIESRDLIDLSMMRVISEIPQKSLEKAENAYSVKKELISSIKKFQTNKQYREKCFSALQIDDPKTVIDGVDLLAHDFELNLTDRRPEET